MPGSAFWWSWTTSRRRTRYGRCSPAPRAASCSPPAGAASRADLVARHGAHRIGLGPLPPGEALRLLRTLVGDRVAADSHSATALTERCGRLPLPLRAAAEAALMHPMFPLSAVDGGLVAADARGTVSQE
ncbi:hypothetical protein [Streptomyces sp. NPDC101234]|uniref:hypothetical protein n=1 Tax=Streptomyces sp. NPDC101234 TaxID=3366138 RepID=UPI00380BCAB1